MLFVVFSDSKCYLADINCTKMEHSNGFVLVYSNNGVVGCFKASDISFAVIISEKEESTHGS